MGCTVVKAKLCTDSAPIAVHRRAMQFAILPETEYHRQCGARLRQAIDACQMKQVEAARIMGVTKNHLGNWLRGDAPIRLYHLYRFCRISGVTADWVLLGDPSGLPTRISQQLLSAEPAPEPAAL